jgi:hypothetical protein
LNKSESWMSYLIPHSLQLWWLQVSRCPVFDTGFFKRQNQTKVSKIYLNILSRNINLKCKMFKINSERVTVFELNGNSTSNFCSFIFPLNVYNKKRRLPRHADKLLEKYMERYLLIEQIWMLNVLPPSLEMPVPSQGHYGFHSFPVVDWFCLFI